jgi:hypothetical protein
MALSVVQLVTSDEVLPSFSLGSRMLAGLGGVTWEDVPGALPVVAGVEGGAPGVWLVQPAITNAVAMTILPRQDALMFPRTFRLPGS